MRKAGGQKSYQIFHLDDDPNSLVLLIEWDSLDPAPVTVMLKSEEAPGSPATPQPQSPLAPQDDPYYLELEHIKEGWHSC